MRALDEAAFIMQVAVTVARVGRNLKNNKSQQSKRVISFLAMQIEHRGVYEPKAARTTRS